MDELISHFYQNSIGTPEERGLLHAVHESGEDTEADFELERKIYGLPFGMSWIERTKWTKYVPFCPTFVSKNEATRNDRDDGSESDSSEDDNGIRDENVDKKM